MKIYSISPLVENESELHLPELVLAASLGDLQQVEKLLESGINANQIDDDGYSALHAAAENNHLAIVKLLLQHGANLNYKAQYSALELANLAGNTQIVAYLSAQSEE